MLMFAFHFTFLLILVVFAGGMVLMHFAAKERGSTPLKVAGLVLVVSTVLSAVCMVYYAAKYWKQGDFDSAHPMMGRMMKMHGGMMGPGMMGPRMKRHGMMGPGHMQGPKDPQSATEPAQEPEAPVGSGDTDEHGH